MADPRSGYQRDLRVTVSEHGEPQQLIIGEYQFHANSIGRFPVAVPVAPGQLAPQLWTVWVPVMMEGEIHDPSGSIRVADSEPDPTAPVIPSWIVRAVAGVQRLRATAQRLGHGGTDDGGP